MAVRIKEWVIPYKWWVGIEITNNHIINVLLREANNLIHVNENNELYVDLQIPDGVTPDYNFEVWVTTGKILQEDWWPQSGLILNWKTASWDYARLIYANDWNVYIDIGDGIWRQIGINISDLGNVKAFFPATLEETTEWQAMVDWYLEWKYPIVIYRSETYLLEARPTYRQLRFYDIHTTVMNLLDDWYSYTYRNALYATWDSNDVFQWWMLDQVIISPKAIDVAVNYAHPYNPLYPSSPATKKYVDDGLALKQDVLTAGTRISITVDPNTWQTIISADVSGAMVYNGNVTDPSQLPSSGNTQWDCWYSESNGHMYVWDWTQWKDVGWTWISYTAGTGINIDSNNVISNTSPFSPSNQWNVGDVIKKTQNWYEWWPDDDTTYSAWSWININNNNVISNTWVLTVNSNQPDANGNVNVIEFDPENAGSTGQVLKKTANGYEWANESWWWNTYYAGSWIDIDSNNVISNEWVITVNNQHPDPSWNINVSGTNYTAWSWIRINSNDEIINDAPFDPDNIGGAGQVLKKTQNWYERQNESSSYTAWDWINIDSNNVISNTNRFIPDNQGATGQVLVKTQNGYKWANAVESWNVKLFTLNTSSTPTSLSLTEAQAAWDWYKAWKLPILRAYGTHQYTDTAGTTHNMTGWWDYYPEPSETGAWLFTFTTHHDTYDGYEIQSNYWYTEQHDYTITLTISNDTTVTAVNSWSQTAAWTQFLSPWVNYATPYTPQYPWSPATKQYVDSRNWVWTQAQYNNLPSIDPTVIYNII